MWGAGGVLVSAPKGAWLEYRCQDLHRTASEEGVESFFKNLLDRVFPF